MSKEVETDPASPEFGEADLTNCEREQIHLPGSIQPHGALLALNPDLEISHVSVNAAELLGFDPAVSLIGRRLDALGPDLAEQLQQQIPDRDLTLPSVLATPLNGSRPTLFDCVYHQSASGQLVLEFEPVCQTDRTLSIQLKSGVDAIAAAASLQSLCDVTAQLLKQVLGYDRVMVYRFDADGHGQVFAEQCEPGLEPYLGNHYPASDIPKNARDLYVRNRVRMLVDVDYAPVPIDPACNAVDGDEFDMSMCHLRSISPMHLQYLRNMGVASTLVTSLTLGDSLWGLIACHGAQPRRAGYTTRAAAELVAEVVAMRISALESVTQTRVEQAVRRLDQSMIDVLAHDGDWPKALFDNAQGLLQVLDATGAVLSYDGGITSIGSVPDDALIRELTEWLDENAPRRLFFTENLGDLATQLKPIADQVPGVLAFPVSDDPGEYLICFRPETVRTIVWGGDPRKPVETGETGAELTPRRSFAQWRELLKGRAIPWNRNEIAGAELVGKSIRNIVHQIRAVRALITHRQLESLTSQLERSAIPGLIADPEGNVILANQSLGAFVWRDSPPTTHLRQFARYFEESSLASHSINELLSHQRSWRGSGTIDSKPVLVRADPVPSPDGGALGYIVLLTDISEALGKSEGIQRKLDNVMGGYALPAANLPDALRAEYDSLAAAVLDNARLAAMEISDGVDPERVTSMLDGIEDAVARTTRLIEALATHSTPSEH